MRHALVAVIVASCGSGPDDCERIYDKMTAALPVRPPDKDNLLASCRADIAHIRGNPESKCILDADTPAAVRDCVNAAFREGTRRPREAKPDKP